MPLACPPDGLYTALQHLLLPPPLLANWNLLPAVQAGNLLLVHTQHLLYPLPADRAGVSDPDEPAAFSAHTPVHCGAMQVTGLKGGGEEGG